MYGTALGGFASAIRPALTTQPRPNKGLGNKQNPIAHKALGFFYIHHLGKLMSIFTIDEKDYDTDTLSDEAKAQIVSIQFVDQE